MLTNLVKRRFSSHILRESIENRMLINGEFLYSLKGKTFKTYNPATEEVITEV